MQQQELYSAEEKENDIIEMDAQFVRADPPLRQIEFNADDFDVGPIVESYECGRGNGGRESRGR